MTRSVRALLLSAGTLAVFCSLVAFRHPVLRVVGLTSNVLPRELVLYGCYLIVAISGSYLAISRRLLSTDEMGLSKRRVVASLILFAIAFVWAASNYGGRAWLAWWTDAPELPQYVEALHTKVEQSRLARTGPPTTTTIVAVGVGRLLSPVAEELIYRGLLLASIREVLGRILAVLISAGVFFVAHATVYGYGFHPWFLFAGLIYGLVFVVSRSLWASLATHWGFNFGNFAVEIAIIV